MSLVVRVILEQVKLFLVVHRSVFDDDVALNIFILVGNAHLEVFPNHAHGFVGVAANGVTDLEVEFEPLGDGCFQGGNAFEEANGLRPLLGVCKVNQGFPVESKR